MTKGKAYQLIIIGNGFDLHCGLKTGFHDYLKYATKKVDSEVDPELLLNDKEKTSPFYQRLSWWDLYFSELKTVDVKNWASFERQIEILVRSEAKNLFLEKKTTFVLNHKDSNIPTGIKLVDKDIAKGEYDAIVNGMKGEEVDKLVDFLKAIITNNHLYMNRPNKPGIILDILLDELRIFERNLNDFLSMQLLEGADEYRIQYESLMERISGGEKYNLLSFNYTFRPSEVKKTDYNDPISGINLYKMQKHEIQREDMQLPYTFPGDQIDCVTGHTSIYDDPDNKKCISSLNIHGKLHGQFHENYISYDNANTSIITGIDGFNISASEPVYRFTKTFRLFEGEGLSDNECIQKGIDEIKFFGHSLAQADYSYFQAIFDFYHIYDSDVKLIFYYADRRSKEEKEKTQGDQEKLNLEKENSKREVVSNLVRLIEEYGKTLDNKDHGKNLLHKLLLEGRLRIEYI